MRRTGIALPSGASAKLIINAARFVSFRSENVQTARRHDFFMFFRHNALCLLKLFLELFGRGFIRIDFETFQIIAGKCFGISAEQNVSSASSHIGRNRNRAFTSGLGDNLGFLFVIFRIENFVRNADLFKFIGDEFGIFNRNRPDQNRLTFSIKFSDFINYRIPFFGQSAVNYVCAVLANHRAVGRNNYDIETVNRSEFFRFGFGSSGHTAEFFIHTEIILQRDSCQCLVFAFDLYAFFCFNRLMKSVRPAATLHQTSREIVNNDNFAFLHNVMMVFFIQCVRFKGLLDTMQKFHIRRIVKV